MNRVVKKEIEQLRWELYHLVNKKGLVDSQVLVTSQKLDQKLNEYHKVLNLHK